MQCMRCGREKAIGQVFCKECLADMEQHPVDPSTPVVLPTPIKATAPRRSTRKTRKPEEQLSRLRRTMTGMLILFIILILAATALIYSMGRKINSLEQTIVTMTEETN